MIIADGQITLPSGLIASYHIVTSVTLHLTEELVSVGISSWGNEEASKKGYAPDKQIASIPFSEVANLKPTLMTLRDMLFAKGGPLDNTVLRT